MKEEVRKLWELCFDDSEAFTDLYFRLRYNNDVNLAIRSGEEVIAALQMLPYPMTFGREAIGTAYISGACTHPDYRNRGVMRELLSQAFARMHGKGVILSTLIPAEPWLFGFYARSGYAPAFRYRQETFADTSLASGEPALAATDRFTPETHAYLDRKLRERPCCLLHTEADYRVILAALRLDGGKVYFLPEGKDVCALAVAHPTDNGWQVDELVADSPEKERTLLRLLCREHGKPLSLLRPPLEGQESRLLGMARIIDAPTVLRLYAATHPDIDLDFDLADDQLHTNNGHYRLAKGRCTKNAKRLPGTRLALTIGQLAERIFSAPGPYMSLMLN